MADYIWLETRTWLSDRTSVLPLRTEPLPTATAPEPAPKKRVGKYTRRVARRRINRIARRLLGEA